VDIKDSVILITGGAIRVGRSVALHLAAQGAHIAFSYYLESEPWKETQIAIEALGVTTFVQQLEVRAVEQVKAFVEATVAQFGRIDILINNASVWSKSSFLNITEADWDLALDINLKGPFLLSQAVAPHMVAQNKGLIINITDLSAFQVWPGYTHHAASKAGLVSLTKSLAVELAPAVRVNAIAPGTVLLPDDHTPEKKKWAVENSLLQRVGSPEDVAQLVAYLIENDFTTGAVFFVDGGRSLV
jgi:NAD(P)-dependent dehydrogenase (short-subunit alcohol dehydrogenase family)